MNYLTNMDWVLPLRSESLTPFMRLLTEMGGLPGLLFLTSFGLWILNKQLSARLIILLAIGYVVNATLKDSFEDPRPDPIYQLIPAGEGGFPSGHAQGAVLFWYGLAFELRRPWFFIPATFMTLAIAFSRIYLGVHDLEDVLGGLFVGAVLLVSFYGALPHVSKLCQSLGPLPILPGLYAAVLLWWWVYPAEELSNYPLFAGALLIGAATGLFVEATYVDSVVPSSFWTAFGLLCFGLLGLFVIAAALYWLELGVVPLIVSLALWQTLALPYFFGRRA